MGMKAESEIAESALDLWTDKWAESKLSDWRYAIWPKVKTDLLLAKYSIILELCRSYCVDFFIGRMLIEYL